MSVVAGRILDGGGYEIAADSVAINGWTIDSRPKEQGKLVHVNRMDIGIAGSVEEMGMFQAYARTHQPAVAEVPEVLEFLAEFASWKTTKFNVAGIDIAYILGYKERLFWGVGFEVIPVTEYDAIGCGRDFALAALHMGGDVKHAVEIAIELSALCAGPVVRFERRPT